MEIRKDKLIKCISDLEGKTILKVVKPIDEGKEIKNELFILFTDGTFAIPRARITWLDESIENSECALDLEEVVLKEEMEEIVRMAEL